MLTNIASAIDKEPSIAQNIPKLTIMGGHFYDIVYQGTTLPQGIDYNLCSDPIATCKVLKNAQIKNMLLVPADVTLHTYLTESHLETLRKIDHPFVQTMVRDVQQWTPKQRYGKTTSFLTESREFLRRCGITEPEESNVAFLHDPLALYCAVGGPLCELKTEKVTIIVDTTGLAIQTKLVTDLGEQGASTTCGVVRSAKNFLFAEFFVRLATNHFHGETPYT